jgi:hypothetical protein
MTTGAATADHRSSELADRKQDRMDSWQNGFTPKQRNARKAVASVPEEGQPLRSTVIRRWAVVFGEHASDRGRLMGDHVFIDVDSERCESASTNVKKG